jgi:FkbM family methyltransferase
MQSWDVLRRFVRNSPLLKKALKPLYGLYRQSRQHYLKRLHPEGGFMSCNGAPVFCDFSDDNFVWYDGRSDYLAHELEVFTSLFDRRRPEVILDVGAHWGFYPAVLSRLPVGQTIKRVISVEADPENSKMLARTLERIERLPVIQVSSAISDADGTLNLYAGGGSCPQTYQSPSATLSGTVRAVTLDTLVREHVAPDEHVTHIKLDIDGYEPAFFAGGMQTLLSHRPEILMEFWAAGLKASGIDLAAYWRNLLAMYVIRESLFSTRSLIELREADLPALVARTTNAVTNLVLIPKERPDLEAVSWVVRGSSRQLEAPMLHRTGRAQ